MAKERNANVVFANRVDAPFWQGLAEGVVKIQHCMDCQNWIWPAEWRCGTCGSFELRWEEINPEGTVYAWNRTYYPFVQAYADLVPYVNIFVELPHAGNRRLLGLLLKPDDDVRIGAPVVPVIEPPSKRTRDLYALRWRLRG
jgi:uncharacterized OB-fold protein